MDMSAALMFFAGCVIIAAAQNNDEYEYPFPVVSESSESSEHIFHLSGYVYYIL